MTFTKKFSGTIIIEEKKRAVQEARRYRTGTVMCVDGSKLDQGNAGAAVCWKDKASNSWKGTPAFLGKNKGILDAELWAIANGLDVARKITQETNTPITIFSDSREALTEIQKVNPYTDSPYLKSLIHQKTNDLKQHGHPVTIRWIPSHVGLVGHDQADQKAKNTTCRGGKPEEQWSSLTNVKRKLVESQAQELTRWHETKRQEREISRRGFYIPRLEKGMSKVLGSTSKNMPRVISSSR